MAFFLLSTNANARGVFLPAMLALALVPACDPGPGESSTTDSGSESSTGGETTESSTETSESSTTGPTATGTDSESASGSSSSSSTTAGGGVTPEGYEGPFDAPNGNFCGSFDYTETWGEDLESGTTAFEADLEAKNQMDLYLEIEPIEGPVYDKDNVEIDAAFYTVIVRVTETEQMLYGLNDIFDEHGNQYWIDWCPD